MSISASSFSAKSLPPLNRCRLYQVNPCPLPSLPVFILYTPIPHPHPPSVHICTWCLSIVARLMSNQSLCSVWRKVVPMSSLTYASVYGIPDTVATDTKSPICVRQSTAFFSCSWS